MTRDESIALLYGMQNEHSVHYMARVVGYYIHHRKGVNWNPQGSVDINQLQSAYEYARMWFEKEFNLVRVYDKSNQLIRVY